MSITDSRPQSLSLFSPLTIWGLGALELESSKRSLWTDGREGAGKEADGLGLPVSSTPISLSRCVGQRDSGAQPSRALAPARGAQSAGRIPGAPGEQVRWGHALRSSAPTSYAFILGKLAFKEPSLFNFLWL